MWIGGILAAVVVVGIIAAAVFRNRTRDEVHSVEHYHRQLHTLEDLRTHSPSGSEGNGDNGHDDAAHPASAFRVSGSSTVRLTDPGHTIVPPAPPPPVKNPGEPVLFVDSHITPDASEPSKSNFMSGVDDKAMHSINHRPKRLGALIAVGSRDRPDRGPHRGGNALQHAAGKTSDIGHGDDGDVDSDALASPAFGHRRLEWSQDPKEVGGHDDHCGAGRVCARSHVCERGDL